jgi:arylsulfatase A-like enzyme
MKKNQNKNKNVILLTIDSLRADHLHCMGYAKDITPILDGLANDGILFKNAFSNAPYTPYSIPSFICSQIPPMRKRIKNTIGQVLKNNKYSTAAFNPNPMVFSDTFEGCNINYGFDVYDIMLNYRKRSNLIIKYIVTEFMRILRNKLNNKKYFYRNIYFIYNKLMKMFPTVLSTRGHQNIPTAKEINERAIKWINRQNDKFFLWLHYMDVHEPYAPVDYENNNELMYLITKYRDFPNMLSETEKKQLIELYDLKIKYTDNEIKNLIEKLKEKKCFDNTIIIITSDHGEAFDEHGALGHGNRFKVQLYDEYIHVPLIIYGIDKKGITIDWQVQLLDLAPTICKLLEIPVSPTFLGKSLFLKPEKGIVINSECDIAYRTKNYKLILQKSNDLNNELYNLKNDPQEKINIYNNSKNILKKLESEMISILKESYKKNQLLNIDLNRMGKKL